MPTTRMLVTATCALIVGIVLGQAGTTAVPTDAQVAAAPPTFSMDMRIGGNLYLQTSAEYQAACLQTYRSAEERLRQLAESGALRDRRPAVVMDLDETVFDNSAFQTYLYRTGREYSEESWAHYEQNFPGDVTLIPGARQFIRRAAALGVTVVFLSNRMEKNRASTLSALERLGVAGSDAGERLCLKEASSDKSPRRDRVAARYHVVMLVGDNLRDFAEVFVAPKLPENPTTDDVLSAIAARKVEVDRAAAHWGIDWFILPNPVYGEWDKLIRVDPAALMHPTTMTAEPNP